MRELPSLKYLDLYKRAYIQKFVVYFILTFYWMKLERGLQRKSMTSIFLVPYCLNCLSCFRKGSIVVVIRIESTIKSLVKYLWPTFCQGNSLHMEVLCSSSDRLLMVGLIVRQWRLFDFILADFGVAGQLTVLLSFLLVDFDTWFA